MSDYGVIPTVGSAGYFELRAPLDTLISIGERHTCQAIRRITEYLSQNEDVLTMYTDLGIASHYAQDLVDDVYIASLQSDLGHWLYVPTGYIIAYPLTNGIAYRSVMIGISLPSIPVDRDYTFLETDLSNLIIDALGVTPVIRQVETSRVVLVPQSQHDITQAQRTLVSSGRVTDRSRYMSLQQDHATALAKIQELETYIALHYT
jgi:hypothetical protein